MSIFDSLSMTDSPWVPPDTFDERAKRMLKSEEGVVPHAYQDSLGYWTIGVGRLIDRRKGGRLRPAEIDYLLQTDIDETATALSLRLPWYDDLDEVRRLVLLSMAFQLGVEGLLGFKNTLGMIERGEYEAASRGMLNSLWAKQTPARAKRMSEMMRTGVWLPYYDL